ncbi:MAG TPA: sigma factor, partial [Candidatus Atribacteria bacterium]|nr:sigma factor [Candidatus Atribacteria bacterium]
MGTDVYLLVEQLKKKDPKALEQAMDLYMDSVYRLAAGILRNTGSTMDIEECVQDVFIDAWNLIDQYDPERGSFRTWLLILCKYKALNRRRSLADKARVVELKDFTEDSKPAGSDDIEYL